MTKELLQRCREQLQALHLRYGSQGQLLADIDAAIAQEGDTDEEVYRRTLEVIAVDDSQDPRDTAAQALVDTGFWTAKPAIAQQAEPVATVIRGGLARHGKATCLVRWEAGAEALQDGEHKLYTAPQPPATSGMPEMPSFPLWAVSQSKGYMAVEAGEVERAIKEQRTACYAAGRRQGLEEAEAECEEMARDFRNHDRVRMVAAKLQGRISALLQTRGKNDSGVV